MLSLNMLAHNLDSATFRQIHIKMTMRIVLVLRKIIHLVINSCRILQISNYKIHKNMANILQL